MTLIKFCGMTREDDVRMACDMGVGALGFVMWPKSPRYVAPERVAVLVKAMAADVLPVGVFVSPADEDLARARDAGVRVLQMHGERRDTASADVWVAASLEGALDEVAADATLVLDAHDPVRHGGTGRTIDWARAATIATRRRVLLAGGLTPQNVRDAIRQVKPYGVDVASGIEERPGVKSAAAMKAFVAAVREADQ